MIELTEADIRLQAGLGRMTENYRPDMNMGGMLSIAKVLKVHHYSGTVDVELVNSKDRVTSSNKNKGKFAARLMTKGSYFDEIDKKVYWGTVEPITVGSLVILGFLDNMKSRPIVLGQVHREDNIDTPRATQYPLNDKIPGHQRKEALKTLNIYPSRAYKKFDGEGNFEFSHTSKSFVAMYNYSADGEDILNDAHNGFDHEHLSEMDKKTGKVLETDFEESKVPMKFLFVHRDQFNKPCKWTKMFISEKGLLRFTRDNNDGKLSYHELHEDGSMTSRRQLDDPDHNDGADFAEIKIAADGVMTITREKGGQKAVFTMDNALNINIETTGSINLKSEKTVNIKAKTVNLN